MEMKNISGYFTHNTSQTPHFGQETITHTFGENIKIYLGSSKGESLYAISYV
jgi:hypothetical protein